MALLSKYRLSGAMVACASLVLAGIIFSERSNLADETIQIAGSYLKATHARDYATAYSFISAGDRRRWDEHTYVAAQGAREGFALRLARELAEAIELRVIETETRDDRARLTLGYKIPAADELSSLLFDWDQGKLNALGEADQQRLLNALEKMRNHGKRISIEGRETFNLVRENGEWKIFLDSASGVPVSFSSALPEDSAVEVDVLKRKVFARSDEPFDTILRIRNRSADYVVSRIEHRIAPEEVIDQIAMIACGFLRPLTLQPGETREVSSAYLLDEGISKNTPLHIIFEFKLQTLASHAQR
jgi:hypothetical protein